MKGIIFTAFIQYAEDSFGELVVEHMISGCDLATDGAYTSVGTFSWEKLLAVLFLNW